LCHGYSNFTKRANGIKYLDVSLYKHPYQILLTSRGTISACEYKFPVENGGVNFVVAASLFTHVLEKECQHYLVEIHRVLALGGLALVSIHDQPFPGTKYSGDYSRIDIDVNHFVDLAKNHQLILKKDIGYFHGQHTLLFQNQTLAPIHGSNILNSAHTISGRLIHFLRK
jgi:hypothetical protein